MQRSVKHARSLLEALPTEVIVQVLAYTDACAVGRFASCSSQCNTLIDESSQIIYEAIAHRRLHVHTPCTAGDSGITVDSLPAFALQDTEGDSSLQNVAPLERQLRKAIKYQRTSSPAYDSIKTWRDFVKKRTLIDQAWQYERPSRYAVARCPSFGELVFGIWRFKICSFSRRVIASTPIIPHMGMGVLLSSPRAPALGPQALLKNTRGWTHVEYSNGHLIYIDQTTIEVGTLDPETGDFQRKHSITPPAPVMSYKARYPYLHALSRVDGISYVFDIENGTLVRAYNTEGPPIPAYVELDQWSLFLAGDILTIIDRKTASVHKLLSTTAYEEDDDEPLATRRWTAVHHSLDGRHLVVVGDANELVWIRNYRDTLTPSYPGVDTGKLERNTVVLRLEEHPGDILLENVCVENDRVVFTTQSTFYPVVYLFQLCDWTNFSNFKAQAPQIRILSGGLPTGHDGISRVEMDSTCVYLTASTRQVFKETPGFEDVHPSDLDLAWYKLDNTELCQAHVRPTWPPSSPAQKHDMREFNTEPRVFLNDAVLCYDFSRPHKSSSAPQANETMFTAADILEDLDGLNEDWEDADSTGHFDDDDAISEGSAIEQE